MTPADRDKADLLDRLTRRTDSQRVRDFVIAIAEVDADITRSAHDRVSAIGMQHARALDALIGTGELTPVVEEQLNAQTDVAKAQLRQMTDDFGTELGELARAYRAPESRSQAARVLGFAVISLVGFLVLVGLGVGPVGVLIAILAVCAVAAISLQVERDRVRW